MFLFVLFLIGLGLTILGGAMMLANFGLALGCVSFILGFGIFLVGAFVMAAAIKWFFVPVLFAELVLGILISAVNG